MQLGYPHPDHLLAQLTSTQFAELMAYASLEPFGEYRNEIRHGQQMALTCNINRNPQVKPEPFTAVEFMNFYDRPDTKAAVIDLGPEANAQLIKEQFLACMRQSHG